MVSGQGPEAGFCEYDNEQLRFIKYGECLPVETSASRDERGPDVSTDVKTQNSVHAPYGKVSLYRTFCAAIRVVPWCNLDPA